MKLKIEKGSKILAYLLAFVLLMAIVVSSFANVVFGFAKVNASTRSVGDGLYYGPPVAQVDKPTVYVPPMGYMDDYIDIVWQKPANYLELQLDGKSIVDYEVYVNGQLLPETPKQNFARINPYLYTFNRSFYESDATKDFDHYQVSQLNFRVDHTAEGQPGSGLAPNTQYVISVKAKYSDGSASDSDSVVHSTAPEFVDTVVVDGTTISTENDNTDSIENVQKASIKIGQGLNQASAIIATRNASNNSPTGGVNNWPHYGATSRFRVSNAGVELNMTESDELIDQIWASTQSLQQAIDQVKPNGKIVLKGSGDNRQPIYYVTGSIYLHSDMTFEVEAGAVLLGSPVLDHYPRNLLHHSYSSDIRSQGLINAVTYDAGTLQNIRLIGGGILDGNGVRFNSATGGARGVSGAQTANTDIDPHKYSNANGNAGGAWDESFTDGLVDPTNGAGAGQWRLPSYATTSNTNQLLATTLSHTEIGILSRDASQKAVFDAAPSPSNGYNTRPQLAIFRGVNNLNISGLVWTNPSFHTINLYDNVNVTLQNSKIFTWDGNNADGVGISSTKGISVFNNFFDTGDDSINFAAGQGALMRNTSQHVASGQGRIFNNYARNGHGGIIAAGSHTGAWIGEMVAEDNLYSPSEAASNGAVRMKSTGNTSGGVRDILVRDMAIHYSINTSGDKGAIVIDRTYSDSNSSTNWSPESEVATSYENINVKNWSITGKFANPLVSNQVPPDSDLGLDSYRMVARNFNISDIRMLQLDSKTLATNHADYLTKEGGISLGDISDVNISNITAPEGHDLGVIFDRGSGTTRGSTTSRNVTIKNVQGVDDFSPVDLNWQPYQDLAVTASGNNVTVKWPHIANADSYIILVRDVSTRGADHTLSGELNSPLQRMFVERASGQFGTAAERTWTGPLSPNTRYEIQVVAVSKLTDATDFATFGEQFKNHQSISTRPLQGGVLTRGRYVSDKAAPDTSNPGGFTGNGTSGQVLEPGAISVPALMGSSWQNIRWSQRAQIGESSGIQYYKIETEVMEGEHAGEKNEYRAYFNSFLDPNTSLQHGNRRAYGVAGLRDGTKYKFSMRAVTWTGQEYGEDDYKDFYQETITASLEDLPEWSTQSKLATQLLSDNETLRLTWRKADVTDNSRGDDLSDRKNAINGFAGFRVFVDGVLLRSVSTNEWNKGEVANDTNAVPTGNVQFDEAAGVYYYDLNVKSQGLKGLHTFAVQAGVEIVQYAGIDAYAGTSLGNVNRPFIGDNNPQARRNLLTMGKWTGHGPQAVVDLDDPTTTVPPPIEPPVEPEKPDPKPEPKPEPENKPDNGIDPKAVAGIIGACAVVVVLGVGAFIVLKKKS